MSEISFTLNNITVDPPNLNIEERHQLLVNVDADLCIFVNSIVLFDENVNFLEFVHQLRLWLGRRNVLEPFSFDSSDFEETGLIRFISNGVSFRCSSCWQPKLDLPSVSLEQIVHFSNDFYAACENAISKQLGISLRDYGI